MSNNKETKENEVEETLDNANVNEETEAADDVQDEAAADSEVDKLKEQIAEIQDAHLRLRAEFDN